jgi:outer membrane lipoprotein-sorting protein
MVSQTALGKLLFSQLSETFMPPYFARTISTCNYPPPEPKFATPPACKNTLMINRMKLLAAVAVSLCACCLAAQESQPSSPSAPKRGEGAEVAGKSAKPASAPKSGARPARTDGSPRDVKNDPQALDLLRKLEERYATVQTVSGRFDQVREDPAFQEKVDSTADFSIMKPNKFRADYKPPRASVNLINGEYSYQYVPELKQVNRYRFRDRETVRDLNYMLLGFGAKTEDLLKVYSVRSLTQGVAAGYHGIQLIPLDKESSGFSYITILITRDDKLLPAQFSVGQKDGVRTTANLDVERLKFDVRLSARDFEPNFPKDAEIVDIE